MWRKIEKLVTSPVQSDIILGLILLHTKIGKSKCLESKEIRVHIKLKASPSCFIAVYDEKLAITSFWKNLPNYIMVSNQTHFTKLLCKMDTSWCINIKKK